MNRRNLFHGMPRRTALVALATLAGFATFLALWLEPDPPAPVVAQAEPPCIQLADLRPRKAYDPATISRLCERQQYDERFHGNPKRVRP